MADKERTESLQGHTVDLDKLRTELLAAKASEERYQRENDAKFRAIAQRVGSYEEFRDIVKASHLKPVDPIEITSLSASRQPWNTFQTDKREEMSSCTIGDGDCIPKNLQEFLRIWRRLGRDGLKERYRMILKLGVDGMKNIFPLEVSSEIFGDLILSLHSGLSDSEFVQVVPILKWISETERLSLSIDFLSCLERQCLQEIFDKLEQEEISVDFKQRFRK